MAHKKRSTNPEDIAFPQQHVVDRDLVREMQDSYLAYSMSVIVARALPDVRDGLKPVHRRILYTMYEAGLTNDKQFKKSATTVGDVLGSYHPHGDSSVYDALVRLAQDFSLRYQLVQGHGNFGSVDGYPAAHYRYTEARLAKISDEMLRDLEKETVDYDPNFDESKLEPKVLPARFPNLLVNGTSGIAVGMATNMPAHNLGEVIDACCLVIRDSEATLDDIMEYIKGPDFPTGGVIVGRSGIRAAYATGRGKFILRGKCEIEEDDSGRSEIHITEIPYQVNRKTLIETIIQKAKEKAIEGVAGWRDETGRDGMRMVVEVAKGASAQVVLNQLYHTTQLQTGFSVINLALTNRGRQPKVFTLRELLDEYIAHQIEVIVRRTQYDLKKARERAHILEGLRIAVDNIDEVIKIIRSAYSDARERLMERFGLSEVQAQAILELQLRRLQGLEREKIEDEYNALLTKIEFFITLLADEQLQKDTLRDELQEIKRKFADARRTEIQLVEDEIDIEDLIEEEDCVFTLTHAGYIKRLPADTYRRQHRGGKGINAMSTREEDYVDTVFTASTHDYILFFTNKGKVYRKKGYQIPEASRTSKGGNVINLIATEAGEKVTAMLHFREMDSADKTLFMATKFGTVKRLRVAELKNLRNNGIRALGLDEGDELIAVLETDGSDSILLATRNGQAICIDENDVRTMGRTAVGVRGIRLRGDDLCVGALKLGGEGDAVLTVTENGFGRRTLQEEYLRSGDDVQNRGGVGRRNGTLNDKTGLIASVLLVNENEDLLIITDDGTIIRTAATSVNVIGRTGQGVRLMRVPDGVKVVGVATVDSTDSSEQIADSSEQPEVEGNDAEDIAE
ncbi:MAG: DNA gyrase subunit A [Oscillospiraceae bacterium]|jgi:DNA gyrase subunit A|nr:DNA gyrase subunit A [Oscillospiraceae bacterium]